MVNVDVNVLLGLASAILTLIAALAGAKYQKVKSKAEQVAALLNAVVDAAKDDKITEEEFQAIVDKVKVLSG